jgi:hypothetical protein
MPTLLLFSPAINQLHHRITLRAIIWWLWSNSKKGGKEGERERGKGRREGELWGERRKKRGTRHGYEPRYRPV